MTSDRQRRRRALRPAPGDFPGDAPETSFYVGDYEYVVEWGPPLIPAVVLRLSDNNPMALLGTLLFVLPATWLAWRIDPRVRVAISRRTGHHYFRMVHVEYFVDDTSAQKRQVEIRKSWVYGDWESEPPLRLREVLEIYRSARAQIPRVRP